MCPPAIGAAAAAIGSMSTATMFAVSLGVSALTAGAQYMQQSQYANAQIEAQNANLEATAAAANADVVQQSADLHSREDQLRGATALRLEEQKTNRDQAAATARATSLSAGASFDALMADYDRQYGQFASSQMTQLGWDMEQIERTREGIAANAQSRVNTVPRQAIERPSLLVTGASIAGGALSAFDKYSVRDPATGQRTLT